jgi:glutathione S-transferase
MSVTDRSNRPDVLGGLNPALRVPTLILDDGRALGESHAIVWYFAEATQYLPEDRFARARVLQWMCFEQYDLEPTVAVVRFWELYADSPPPPEEIEARRALGQRAIGAIEQALAGGDPFLVAERYTIADIALYGYTHVAHEAGFDMSGYPAIAAWMERIREQPGHVEITA